MKTRAITLPTAVDRIPRRLTDDWNYRPDWRCEVIDQYLVEIAGAKDRSMALQAILWRESDPYVRQALRFRYAGTCVHQRAIEWAFRTAQSNPANGLASRIKAAVVADRFSDEIAEVLNCEPAGVVAFEKIFWDVRRRLGSELSLRSMVEEIEAACSTERAARREVYWLRTALDEGWSGLQRIWFPKFGGSDAKSLGALGREIEFIAARRTLRHLQNLEETGAPVGDDDLKRLAILSRRSGSGAAVEQENGGMRDFFSRLLEAGTRNLIQAPETPKAEALKLVFAEKLGLTPPSASSALVKVRKRSAR